MWCGLLRRVAQQAGLRQLVQAEDEHRGHAIVEQVIADLYVR